MNLGWDPIDELEEDGSLPLWAKVVFFVLLSVVIVSRFI